MHEEDDTGADLQGFLFEADKIADFGDFLSEQLVSKHLNLDIKYKVSCRNEKKRVRNSRHNSLVPRYVGNRCLVVKFRLCAERMAISGNK